MTCRFIFYQLCSVRCPKAPHRSQKSRIPCLAAPMRSQNPWETHLDQPGSLETSWNLFSFKSSEIFRDISVAGNNPGDGGTYPPSPSTLQGLSARRGRPSGRLRFPQAPRPQQRSHLRHFVAAAWSQGAQEAQHLPLEITWRHGMPPGNHRKPSETITNGKKRQSFGWNMFTGVRFDRYPQPNVSRDL